MFPSRGRRMSNNAAEEFAVTEYFAACDLNKQFEFYFLFYVNTQPRIRCPAWAAAHTVLITISNRQHGDVYFAVSCFGHIGKASIFLSYLQRMMGRLHDATLFHSKTVFFVPLFKSKSIMC